MDDTLLDRYYRILNMGEDYLRCGCRKHHPDLHAAGFRGIRKAEPERAYTGSPLRKDSRTVSTGNSVSTDPSTASPEQALEALAQEIRSCRACRLCEGRMNAVPGEGVSNPRVMIIGEAPGAQEDRTGRPFVGPAGHYLDKWMDAIGLDRKTELFIGNVIKCRPPENRDPLPDEAAACRHFLDRQIAILRPGAILTVGRISMQLLLDTGDGIGRRHGELSGYQGIPLIPTYHPSGVLRNPQYRVPVWEDLKALKRIIGGRS